MTTPTAARTRQEESSHWYYPDGRSCYSVPYADPSKGMRNTTLADARKLGLMPSVTNVLNCLAKPGLEAWKIEMAVIAVASSPRKEGEQLDAFIYRVLHLEKQQDQVAAKARDLGTEIHAEIELALNGNPVHEHLSAYVLPVLEAVKKFGTCKTTEQIVVGEGYAGKADACFYDGSDTTVVDFKSTSKLPKKESWLEHRAQLGAYAKPLLANRTANIYISTTEPGKIAVFINPPPQPDYEAFMHIFAVWKWQNNWKQ